MHISDHATSDEDILNRGLLTRDISMRSELGVSTPPRLLCTDQMRILQLLYHLDIIELDIEVLIDRF
jgi:hypothetical protein